MCKTDDDIASPMRWGFGPVDSEWYTKADSREDAIARGRAEYGEAAFEVASGVVRQPSEFFSADNLLEDMAENAGDEYGEIAEGWKPHMAPAEAKQELARLICDWVDKHAPISFWVAETRETIEPPRSK